MGNSYTLASRFTKKYPMSIAWRVKRHCKVLDKHLNPGEEILYVFAAVTVNSVEATSAPFASKPYTTNEPSPDFDFADCNLLHTISSF